MWIGKNAAPASSARKGTVAAPTEVLDITPLRELHVPHQVEHEIAAFLVQKGRLTMSIGKHLLHFTSMTKNKDGSVDYVVKTRMHMSSGLPRNFTSQVRIFPGQRKMELVG